MTGDSRYEVEFSKEDKERGVNMCNVIDKVEKNGIEKGIFDIISRMLKKGKSVQEIVDLTDYEEAKVQEIADALENC